MLENVRKFPTICMDQQTSGVFLKLPNVIDVVVVVFPSGDVYISYLYTKITG